MQISLSITAPHCACCSHLVNKPCILACEVKSVILWWMAHCRLPASCINITDPYIYFTYTRVLSCKKTELRKGGSHYWRTLHWSLCEESCELRCTLYHVGISQHSVLRCYMWSIVWESPVHWFAFVNYSLVTSSYIFSNVDWPILVIFIICWIQLI